MFIGFDNLSNSSKVYVFIFRQLLFERKLLIIYYMYIVHSIQYNTVRGLDK
jgi:hypothetical protein